MKGCEGQISLFDFMEPPKQEVHIDEVGMGALHRYLRYGPHTLVPAVRDECKAYLDSVNGKLPQNFIDYCGDPRKWSPLPCRNCEYGRSGTCRAGAHTCHYEYDVLICDAFKQTIVGDMPTLPCDTCGYIKQSCCDYPCTPDDYCTLGDKWIPNVKPGDWVEKEMLGAELTFDEITQLIGKLIILDKSTQSHEWYKVVMVEEIVIVEGNQRRLVYYDGVKQRGLINEMWFKEDALYYKQKAWKINGEEDGKAR